MAAKTLKGRAGVGWSSESLCFYNCFIAYCEEYIFFLETEIVLESYTKLKEGLEWWKSPDTKIIENTPLLDRPCYE